MERFAFLYLETKMKKKIDKENCAKIILENSEIHGSDKNGLRTIGLGNKHGKHGNTEKCKITIS